MESIFAGIFDNSMVAVISPLDFLLCIGASLLLGLILALAYSYKTRFTKSFVTTLALIPAVVCVVIMMVNGNIGAGVAVAGAFSLVRFRSVPGTAKEIGAIFIAMGAGLIAGMGYLAFAALFTLILSLSLVIYSLVRFGVGTGTSKLLTITIPEDLNWSGVFDEIFKRYTESHECVKVKTTNLGSMFKLSYNIVLRSGVDEKEFIDSIREKNGNLEVMISERETVTAEL